MQSAAQALKKHNKHLIFSSNLTQYIKYLTISLTIGSLGQMGRFELISQMPDLIVGHGQPAGALLQVPLQAGTFLLHADCPTSQIPGLSLLREKGLLTE